MNHLAPLADPASLSGTGSARAVNRAIGDLRRGVPVLLDSVLLEGAETLVLLPIETATDETLAEFRTVAAGPSTVLLAPGRARALSGYSERAGRRVVALRAPASASMVALRALADPVRDHDGEQDAADILMLPAPPFGVRAAEAAITLAKLGRLLPAILAAPASIGAPTRDADLLRVGEQAVLTYAASASTGLAHAADATVPLAEAPDTRIVAFRPPDGGIEHLAIVIGHPGTAEAPLVRVHSECFTGDLLGSLRCDCGPQLHQAIRLMEQEGAGVVLYMAQEGRGIGLVNKLRAYTLQDAGLDTLDANQALGFGADERSFDAAAVMLRALGIGRVRLLTNNPDKVASLTQAGIEVAGRVSLAIAANGVNDFYLDTKARRFGHLLG